MRPPKKSRIKSLSQQYHPMGGCLRCGRCCTSFGVCVTPFDILRLSRATGFGPADLVMTIFEPPERERDEPAIRIDGKPSLLVLRWRGNPERRCLFLSDTGCMAYDSRPMLCRTYPFKAANGKLKDLGSRACPRLWVPQESGSYLEDFKRYELEVQAYQKIAKEWNSGLGGSLGDFLSFALSRAERAGV